MAIKMKERSALARITEVEEYIGLLRHKHAMIQNRAEVADEQMGIALDILHQHGIAEQTVSDCEDEDDIDILLSHNLFHRHSDPVSSDTDLSSNAESDSDSEDYPVTSSGTNHIDHVGVARAREVQWLGPGEDGGRVSPSEGAARSDDAPTK